MNQANSPSDSLSYRAGRHSLLTAVVSGCTAICLMQQFAAALAAEQAGAPKDIESREKIIAQTLRNARQKLEDERRKVPDAENSAIIIQKPYRSSRKATSPSST